MTPRDTARAWLADPLGVVLDFETTGWVGMAVEIAVIGMDGGVLLHTRLHPGCAIEEGAQAVHGITLDTVADAPTWGDVESDVARLIAERCVVAYGAPFDRGVYARETQRSSRKFPCAIADNWRCAMQLYRQHAGLAKTVKLETLVPTANHSALGDARACLEVVRRVAA